LTILGSCNSTWNVFSIKPFILSTKFFVQYSHCIIYYGMVRYY